MLFCCIWTEWGSSWVGNKVQKVEETIKPAYWLLISFASYRALLQLITNPFHWEKTEHGVSSFTAPTTDINHH